jgi:hypothetical protein
VLDIWLRSFDTLYFLPATHACMWFVTARTGGRCSNIWYNIHIHVLFSEYITIVNF